MTWKHQKDTRVLVEIFLQPKSNVGDTVSSQRGGKHVYVFTMSTFKACLGSPGDRGGPWWHSSTPFISLAEFSGNYTQTMGHLILSFPSLSAILKVLKIDLLE